MLILTPEEIKEVTGKARRGAQTRELRRLGLEVKVRADGVPIVSRQHFELKFGGNVSSESEDKVVLNFDDVA